MKTAYLGPEGTFSQEAAALLSPNSELIPYKNFRLALKACANGETDNAVIPIENSIEGVVNASIDELVFEEELYIQKSINLTIVQNLMVKKGSKPEDIVRIISHSHALPQCKKFIGENFPNAELRTVSSTGEAVKIVSGGGKGLAAIGSSAAAKIYGLDILASSVQDSNKNYTQFVLVGKEPTLDYNGKDVATLAFSTKHEPGALYGVLEILAVYDINMLEIFSRPMKNRPSEYVFVVDLAIENNSEDIKKAIELMKRKSSFIKLLGIYTLKNEQGGQ